VLANNPKGEKLVYHMKQRANIKQRPVAEQLQHQKRLSEPVKYPYFREEFWQELRVNGFDYVMNKYVYKK
jgi:hypothetical protein